jgi:penicillin V acylase-like amidase (Ntn superfamily)
MKRQRESFFARCLQLGVVLALVTAFAGPAETCTRALYVGKDGLVITGRSMDWGEDMHSNLWVFPRGMSRDGAAGPNSVKWTSKYGSLAGRI